VTVGSIRQVSVSYSCVMGVVGAGILSAVRLAWLAQATMIFRDLRRHSIDRRHSALTAFVFGGFYMPLGMAFFLWPRMRDGVLDLQSRAAANRPTKGGP
jgi:hypothetical protein